MNFTFHACLIRRSTAGSLLWLCCVTRHSSSIVARVVLGLLWAYTAPWIIIMTQTHSFRVGFSAVKPKPNGNNSSQSQGRRQSKDNLQNRSRVQVKDLILFLIEWQRGSSFCFSYFLFFLQLSWKTWLTKMRIALATQDWKTVVKERFQVQTLWNAYNFLLLYITKIMI